MAQTRILTVNLPRFLVGVMSAIVAGAPDLLIVGDTDADGVFVAISLRRPDVVVLGGTRAESRYLLERLREFRPLLRIVTIDGGGKSATAYEPGGASRSVAEVSSSTFVQMLSGPLQ